MWEILAMADSENKEIRFDMFGIDIPSYKSRFRTFLAFS